MAILNMKIGLIAVTIRERALELKLHGFTPPSEVEHDTESRQLASHTIDKYQIWQHLGNAFQKALRVDVLCYLRFRYYQVIFQQRERHDTF